MTDSVLVVGGGVAGLGLARALSLRGVPSTVLERRPAVESVVDLGLNLPGNAIRALRALGVADEVARAGVPVQRREYRDQSGRLMFAVGEAAFWGEIGPSVCVRRSALLRILRTVVVPQSVRWECAVARAVPLDGAVRVEHASGLVEEHPFVVGADGIHSAIRPAVADDGGVRPSTMTAASWRFVVPNPGVECWTVWSGAGGTLLLIPVDERHVYGYASPTRGGAADADPDWLTATFDSFPEPVRGVVAAARADPDGLYHSPVGEIHVRRWSRDRITLVGDAAHAIGPVWAQGAALALEDALVLAGLLSERSDWAGVGTEFERLRRPRVNHVQAATERMSRLAGLPVWMRDLATPWVGPRTYRAAYGPLRRPF